MWKLIAAALLVAACGKVNTDTQIVDAFHGPDAARVLTGITVTAPTPTTITSEALTATAMYSDQFMADVSTTATWTSDSPGVATVDTTGKVTAVTGGSAVIHAMFEGVDGMTTIGVAIPTLAVSSYSNPGIDFFPVDASGNVAPVRSVRGALTTFVNPRGLFIVGNELYVADQGAHAIEVFDLGASGNVAPKRTIAGATTTLVSPSQLLVANNQIYVADQTAAVKVFATTDTGDVAPTRTITVSTIAHSLGVAATATELYVDDYSSNNISVVPINSNGATTPTRQIVGNLTALSGAQGLLLLNDELYVSNSGGNSITVYPMTANGNVAPTRSIVGAATMLSYPDELALVGTHLYSTNYSNSTVESFTPTIPGNQTPTTSLGGASTSLSGNLGLAAF